MRRRKEDKCLVKRLWNIATPYIQMGGWLIIAVPIILSTSQLLSDASAFQERLSSVERAQTEYEQDNKMLSQKLDLVIYLLRKPK